MFKIYMNVVVKRGKLMDIKAIQNTNFGWITDRAKAQLIPLINKKNTRIYKDAREKFNFLDKYEYSIIDYDNDNDTYNIHSTEYIITTPVKTKNNIYLVVKDLFERAYGNWYSGWLEPEKRSKKLTLDDFNNK